MIMIFCEHCDDTVSLTRSMRYCQCGASKGIIIKRGWLCGRREKFANIYGPCSAIWLVKDSLVRAIDASTNGVGKDFKAFVMPG